MKLVYFDDGHKIYYNNGETFTEYVYALDNNNNLIQKAIFPCDIQLDINLTDIISNYKTINIDKGFLLYAFAYEISFGHYLGQTIPKLYEYMQEYSDYKLIIPKNRYHNICKEILNLVNIDFSQIEILEEGYIYNIENYINIPNFNCVPDMYTPTHINIYNKIREPLLITENKSPNRNVYLKRDNKKCLEFGNNETGILRQILNEEELILRLRDMNFEIITLADKYISEKKELLNNINILMTPLGANCYNFIFCNAPKHIIYLSNTENFGNNFYTSLSSELNKTYIKDDIFRYSGFVSDSTNQWNNSFYVNIDEIISYIMCKLNK